MMSVIKWVAIKIIKMYVTPRCNICDIYRGQTATKESSLTDECQTVGYRYRGKTTAINESKMADGGHSFSNIHRGQTAATSESIIPDRSHPVGDY